MLTPQITSSPLLNWEEGASSKGGGVRNQADQVPLSSELGGPGQFKLFLCASVSSLVTCRQQRGCYKDLTANTC